MTDPNKNLLPNEWWATADCVDAYESQGGDDFPSLRRFVDRVAPEHRGAALAELVKVDIERRWQRGKPRRVEDYLGEYPELSSSGMPLEELVQHEYLVRSKHGDNPTVSELRSRFPKLDERKVLESDQKFTATIQFGLNPLDTKASTASEPGPSGTIIFDSAAPKDSTLGDSAAISRPAPAKAAASPSKAETTPSHAAPPPERHPESIGRYTVKKVLGSGSFGLVYRCFDEDLKREVAIKVPHVKATISKDRVKEFMHEARSAARLRHGGIVTVLDTNQTDDGRVYIVYEFIKGKTLQDSFEEGKYTHADAARWTAEAAEALHHAHKNQIVHRDVKPANLLLDEDGHVHVADFGLARMDDQFFRNDAGRVLGTIAYMSPEQASGQSHWVSPQADIYSLGVMLYQLLTKRLPFSATSMEDALAQIKERIPAPPRTVDDSVSKELEAVCLKSMAKSPTERYSTAADMAADLRAAVAEKPPARTSNRMLIAAAGAGALLIGLLAWSPWRDRTIHVTDLPPKERALFGTRHEKLPAGVPWLGISRQKAGENVRRPLNVMEDALHEGDLIQLSVVVDKPQYVYLYWYNAKGEYERLWPKDPAEQTKVESQLRLPVDNDEDNDPNTEPSYPLDAEIGAELALLATRDEPLTAEQIAEFEKLMPYSEGDVRIEKVFHIHSGDQTRGLANEVKTRRNPLDAKFEEAARKTFTQFHGMVVPHQ